MLVVGALMAATMSMPGTAAAAPHRHAYFQRAGRAAWSPSRPRIAAYRHFAAFRPRFAATRAAYRSRFGRALAWHRPLAQRAVAAAPAATFNPLGPLASAVAAPLTSAAATVTRVVSRASGVQTGRASFYGGGGRTAAGGRVGAATCAHRSLPFGTRVLVTNLANARQAVLTVNDRGPFVRGRIVDVSVGAAGVLGMLHSGTAPVRVQVVGGPG